MTKAKIDYRVLIITHLFVLGFGIIGTLAVNYISDYSKRPLIQIQPKSITLVQNFINDWEIFVGLRLINTGNSSAISKIEGINLSIPLLSNRKIYLKADKFVNIPADSSKEYNFSLRFPNVLDSLSLDIIPRIDLFEIIVFDVKYDTRISIQKDSSNFVHMGMFERRNNLIKTSDNIKLDSSSNKTTFVVKPFYIEYKNKRYLNKIFPPDANVRYQIENDKIYLEYSIQSKILTDKNNEEIFEPFIFFPHEDIKDIVIVPTHSHVKFFREIRGDNTNKYDEYSVEITSETRNYFYLLD